MTFPYGRGSVQCDTFPGGVGCGCLTSPLPFAVVNESNSLCLECGLCCNGVIFTDVKLQRADDADHLKGLGLPVSGGRAVAGSGRFPQPCAALEGCRCRIYADRPTYCRQFECLLLKHVQAGRLKASTARCTIHTARARAEQVSYLLEALGEKDQKLALSLRFRRLARKLEKTVRSDDETRLFSQLTLAVHDLNLLLSGEFYPVGNHSGK